MSNCSCGSGTSQHFSGCSALRLPNDWQTRDHSDGAQFTASSKTHDEYEGALPIATRPMHAHDGLGMHYVDEHHRYDVADMADVRRKSYLAGLYLNLVRCSKCQLPKAEGYVCPCGNAL